MLYLLFLLPSCNSILHDYPLAPTVYLSLGSPTASHTWIYLCGLATEFIPEYMHDLATLDAIGKQLNIRFLAMIPTHRCSQLNNMLCWPHETEQELQETYEEIMRKVKNQPISGYIGFSNGGFFLNKLAQFIEIDKPIISIGSAGPLFNLNGPPNTMHLLIGKKDQSHYEHAINLYKQAKDTNLTINLIEYNEGHTIPEQTLKELLQNIVKDNDEKKR